jgi:quercetin dioxygenase-like cupin family protein
VATKQYEAATISELEREDGWAPIRRTLDVNAFGINAWTAREAEGAIISDHDEKPTGHEELYVVVAGRATFTVDGEEIDAPTGTIVFVRDPDSTRGAVAAEPGTTVLSVGGKPGEAYRPRAWEVTRDVFALFDRGEHAEAKQMLLDALERYDDRGGLLYNIACADAQLGNTEDALASLRAGLADRPDLAPYAREDSDFEPIRDDPRFAQIVDAAA